jgi:alpha-glucosidase
MFFSVYGNDVDTLNLTVTYQNADRLSIYIRPVNMDSRNMSWYILNETLVPRPAVDGDAETSTQGNDLHFSWSNDPSFSFTVIRKSTGDVLFNTSGSVLVFEDQFVEFVTSMPQNYNVYGLGERIHGLRLGNNFTGGSGL